MAEGRLSRMTGVEPVSADWGGRFERVGGNEESTNKRLLARRLSGGDAWNVAQIFCRRSDSNLQAHL